ncbi:uncharacterized protein LOC123426005 isoform X1 [Hordeum vulgare subsp. vulgare]|uniref:uncharacterized protein LOC123426005 isoform X1 n=1 Tax=Hordeum vulgare subsp. vulgare TaxID=112509 RepID=UPI001D1A42B7|nr:uncharacterized protein LOC123426005 isoform X1 [Hordeum vulgare subsp. vulgare]
MVTGWQYQRFSAIFPIFPRIGIDSIGGVRVPGGYCRLLAFRLSHVVISNSGVTRIAPSLDTIDTSTYILKRSRMTRKQLMYQDVQDRPQAIPASIHSPASYTCQLSSFYRPYEQDLQQNVNSAFPRVII